MTGYALTETPLGQPLGPASVELGPGDERRRATLGSNSGRIVLAIALMIALLGAAVALSIWRYEAALDDATFEALAQQDQFEEQQASTHFWREREAANEYFLGVTDAEHRDPIEWERLVAARG